MRRDEMEADQVVERYLRNELSDSEIEQFEQRLMWDTEVQDQLELTQRLRQGMRDATVDNRASTAVPPTRMFNSAQYAMAASALLAITTFGWLSTWLSTQQGDVPQTSGQVYSLEITRSAPNLDELPLVTSGSAKDAVTLLVYPDLEAYSQFRAELTRLPGPPNIDGVDGNWLAVWQGAPTTVGGGDTVAVTVPGTLLEPGVHRLRISGWNLDRPVDIASETYFRVPEAP